MNLSKQNILFFTRTMGQGGTESVVLQLCEILKSKANKIVVCSCGGVNVRKLKELGIKHYQIKDIVDKNPLTLLQITKEVKELIRKENITVIHAHHRMAAFYAKLAAKKSIIRIVSAHNIFKDKIRLTHWAYKDAHVIAVGLDVAKNLEEVFEIPQGNISIIYNSVKAFTDSIMPFSDFVKEKEAEKVLIGNIGRLSEQKGMKYFIQAARIVNEKMPLTKFYIIGQGEECDNLKEVAKDLISKDALSFLGYRSDIQNIISQLDFIVLSSLWEGFPLTPIEAFSVGKTVIATDVQGTNEIVFDNQNGCLVPAKNAEKLAHAILQLIQDNRLRKRLEENAKYDFDKKFSFRSYSENILNYYERLEKNRK